MSSKQFIRGCRQREPVSRTSSASKIARGAALSLCFVTIACVAQTPPAPEPGLPVPPPVAGGLGGAAQTMPSPPPPPAPAPIAAQQQSVVATGTVSRFVINPEGDVDGFLLADGSLVHFPPHMGSQLVSVIHQGDAVRIAGFRDGAGNITAQQIANERTSRQVVDQPPPVDALRAPPALRGAGLVRLSAKGTVARVTTAPRGEPDGVMLRDGTIIKMPPPVAQQFANLLRPDVVVAATGYGTRNQYGEALQAIAFGTPGNVTQLYNDIPN
ncbi:hypothetical protein P3T17_005930 [Paraburkholderia sp. GAS82]